MRLSIAGGGRAAWTFGRLAIRAGIELGPMVVREGSSTDVPERLGTRRATWDGLGNSDAVLLAVSDEALGEVGEVAAASLPSEVILLHCSGSRDSSLFGREPAGSIHPLAALPSPGTEPELDGTLFVFEGSDAALRLAGALAAAAGGQLSRIRPELKPLYHAGAVFGSNYVAAMLELAFELIGQSGAEAGSREAVASLARSAVNNWEQRGREGLTGPVVRRDVSTISSHLRVLEQSADLRTIYSTIAAELLRMTSADDGEAEKIQRIAALLEPNRIR